MLNTKEKETSVKTLSLRIPESIRSFLDNMHKRYQHIGKNYTESDITRAALRRYAEDPVEIEYVIITESKPETLKTIIENFKQTQPISTAQLRFLFDEVLYAYAHHKGYFDPELFNHCLDCLAIVYELYSINDPDEALYWHRKLGFDEDKTFAEGLAIIREKSRIFPQVSARYYISAITKMLERATRDDFFKLNQKFLPYLPSLLDIAKRGQHYRGLIFDRELEDLSNDRNHHKMPSHSKFQFHIAFNYLAIYLKTHHIHVSTMHPIDTLAFDTLMTIDIQAYLGERFKSIESSNLSILKIEDDSVHFKHTGLTVFFTKVQWQALRQHWQEIRETDIFQTIEQSVADRFGRI